MSYRPSGQWATRQGDPEELLARVGAAGRDALEKVRRRPLYVMAEDEGCRYYQQAFMTNGQLFDAILDCRRDVTG